MLKKITNIVFVFGFITFGLLWWLLPVSLLKTLNKSKELEPIVLNEAIIQAREPINEEEYWATRGSYRYVPTHQQNVWIYLLEWCESRGIKDAINPKDRDGTASYYSFQWKPQTFKHYVLKYKLLPSDLEDVDYFNWMSDYYLSREIIKRMINDPAVVWRQEFPACVLKYGWPPKN